MYKEYSDSSSILNNSSDIESKISDKKFLNLNNKTNNLENYENKLTFMNSIKKYHYLQENS